jgi:hypothetical protein
VSSVSSPTARRWWSLLTILGILILLVYFTSVIFDKEVEEVPPSDEQLVASLQSNRVIFDDLRAIYLTSTETYVPANAKNFAPLMQAAGVQWVIWNARYDPSMREYRAGPKRELHPLRFKMALWRYRDEQHGLDGWNYKSKSLVFFPIAPDGSTESLTWTTYPVAKFYPNRVIAQTDRPPSDWKFGECLFRRIDAHWFVELCNDGIGG